MSTPTFGDLLRRHRLAAGLTQEELAARAQVSPRAISDLERGQRNRPWRDTVQLLAAALQLDPSDRSLLEAAARRGGAASAGPSQEAAPATDTTSRTNLPIQVTSFVGREHELAEVQRLLVASPLVTLTGTGGCGKTRLALQVAAARLASFPDGAWVVELAPLADAAHVPDAVAAALGVRDGPGHSTEIALLSFLRTRQLLVILDNCEHLIQACARLAGAILSSCPGVQILATSREALGVAGELSWRVPSLAPPPIDPHTGLDVLASNEAIRLFVDRARAVQPVFALTEENAAAVAQICWRMDGIPLAIELAATRVRTLSIPQIVARLDQRFRLLTGGSRTALPRQQTLAALVGWSYDLLTDAERALFNRLAVFAGGFDLEAAEAVCSAAESVSGAPLSKEATVEREDVLNLLGALVDKSLVVAESGTSGVERYHLLETLRQYGWERLVEAGEAEVFECRHATYYQTFAEEAESYLEGPDQAAWLDRLEREHNNLRAALRWSREGGDVEVGLRLAGALWLFWFARSHLSEGRDWLSRLLATAGTGATAARAKALKAAGMLAHYQGDGAAEARLLAESLAIRRELGDRLAPADTLMFQGDLSYREGDLAQARALFEEGLALNRALGNEQGVAEALAALSGLAWDRGEYPLARSLRQESLDVHRKLGDQQGIAWMLLEPGWIVLQQGNLASAAACFRESLLVSRAFDFRWGILHALDGFAEVAHLQGNVDRGLRLAGAAEAILASMNARPVDGGRLKSGRQLDLGRHRPGMEAATAAWAAGKAMTLEHAVAYALGDAGEE